MSSKEKVLAIRPGLTCRQLPGLDAYQIQDFITGITPYMPTEEGAWASAYKYLTM